MRTTLKALSDRLLGALVPRVDASASPCQGALVWRFCYCGANWVHQRQCCADDTYCYACVRRYPGC